MCNVVPYRVQVRFCSLIIVKGFLTRGGQIFAYDCTFTLIVKHGGSSAAVGEAILWESLDPMISLLGHLICILGTYLMLVQSNLEIMHKQKALICQSPTNQVAINESAMGPVITYQRSVIIHFVIRFNTWTGR